jgi:opacity protein-like surface antigen
MKRPVIVFACVAVLSGAASAQGWLAGAHYQVAFPAGNVASYIEKTSYQGGAIEIRKFLNPLWSLGLSAGYSRFHKGPSGPLGAQTRTLTALPLMAAIHFYVRNNPGFIPYGGVQVGAFRISRETQAVEGTDSQGNWHLGFIPDLGVIIPVTSRFSFTTGFRFNFGKEVAGVKDQAYYSLHVGFLWGER